MTHEEIELSKKLLHAQMRIEKMREEQDKLFVVVASLINRMRTLETVVEGMCVGRGR
jgi:hypothetical protein